MSRQGSSVLEVEVRTMLKTMLAAAALAADMPKKRSM
jgi:hypothetical protein